MKTDKLEKHYDPEGWQWQDEHGKVTKLVDMSRDDLLQVACNCMEALERAEEICADQTLLFQEWRSGKVKPNLCY